MRTDQKYMLNRSGLPGGRAQNRHSKTLEFEGFRRLSGLNSYNLSFNFGGFAAIKSQAGGNCHKLSFEEVEA